ncbi:biotin transporter BioY [Saliterribacillus persicus]|uniref:Biotin transporter n=1 Tax=Saliterribacillus persicus TaxID=930114 RepID=A0A368XY45_9BACI|nr:biotin transporter BioY [Saliterribacillus persicus]RCW71958.1 biotin transport system substrate-specific component [Saliterribacillus persicus]
MQQITLRNIMLASIFTAITAILAQIEIPLPLVPISGQTLAVGITATIIGSKLGATAMIGYAMIGAIGIPVFAGFRGGLQVIVGPTGGYIIGFIFAAYVTGKILELTKFNLRMAIIANIVGMFITLLFGMTQLKFIVDLTWSEALASGVYPFLIVGFIKAFLASWIGIVVRQRLVHAKLLKQSKTVTP